MDVATLDAPVAPSRTRRMGLSAPAPAAPSAPGAAPGSTPLRPRRRPAPGTRPTARPSRLDAPTVVRQRVRHASRGCDVGVPAAPPRSAHWRLTDRGIALVLVAGLLIATAAIAVVTLTAVRVTGDRYHHPTPNVVSAGQQGGRTA